MTSSTLSAGRRWGPWIALLAVVALAIGFVIANDDGAARTPEQRAAKIARQLACQECENISVADSPSVTSRAIRADIERQIAAGATDREIIDRQVERFGESILLEPRSSGIAVLVWALPIIVLAIAALALLARLRWWKDRPAATVTDSDRELVDRTRRDRPEVPA